MRVCRFLRFVAPPLLVVSALTQIRSGVIAAPPAPPGLQLAVSPQLVDVGDNVLFRVSAKSWPGPVGVTLSFVSPHHGFTGAMVWVPQCSCFEVAVHLAPRIHGIELARASAVVRSHGVISATRRTTFSVRGLAANGHTYAPGGTPSLTAWVTDPSPVKSETQHFCGWVKTADGLGVAGYPVHFVVHYPGHIAKWNGGTTKSSGLVCTQRSIGSPTPGKAIRVDVYAGNLRATTSFTTRAG